MSGNFRQWFRSVRGALVSVSAIVLLCFSYDRSFAVCGDVDASGDVIISDALYLINYIFQIGPPPLDPDGGDVNCSGQLDIGDAVYIVNYLFAGGPQACCLSEEIGVLLTGAPDENAVTAAPSYGPFAVEESDYLGDFITTRMEAQIHPSATVAEVNEALEGIGGKISCVRPGMPFVELIVPPFPDTATARAACTELVESGAFLSAYPAFNPIEAFDSQLFPGFPANGILGHLENARFPAAWNARDLIIPNQAAAHVLVPDKYFSLGAHPELPDHYFHNGAGRVTPTVNSNGIAVGNHGFEVAGIIGARFDDVGITGVYPDPSNLLSTIGVPLGRLATWQAVLAEIAGAFPPDNFIVNFSVGYPGDFSIYPKLQRIEHAFAWRYHAALHKHTFLFVQAAGNEGFASAALPNADYISPMSLAARFDGPLAMLQGTAVSPQDSANLLLMYQNAIALNPSFGEKTDNVIIVGSSNQDGSLSASSNLPSDVRMVGEGIHGPCMFDDAACYTGADGSLIEFLFGTSFAAPQVAGLAAWLYSLSPTSSPEEVQNIIKLAYNNKWVDAYESVLMLDKSFTNAPLRRAILDVSDFDTTFGSDGRFNELDLMMYLDSILAYEADRVSTSPPWPLDHSPFDLNGDGYTGDTLGTPSTARFNLDIDFPPSYTVLPFSPCSFSTKQDTTFDESQVTDRDILKYYAYSDLYQGDTDVRDSLFGIICTPFWSGTETPLLINAAAGAATGAFCGTSMSETNSYSCNIQDQSDSISGVCNSGYSFTAETSVSNHLSASGDSFAFQVVGNVHLIARATARASAQPEPCEYVAAGSNFVSNSIRFAPIGGQAQFPVTFSVTGSVSHTNTLYPDPVTRVSVYVVAIDTTFKSDIHPSQSPNLLGSFHSDLDPLPYTLQTVYTSLPENHVYYVYMEAGSQASAITQKIPTAEGTVDITYSITTGP